MRTSATRPPRARRRAAATALATGLLLGLAGCGDDDGARAEDRTTGAPGSGAASGSAGYPDFAPQDYVYRLEVLCYCPQVGAVRVEVRDGKVVSATSAEGGQGVTKGAQAPDFARLTINDIIAIANDPDVDEVEVTWPDGQDHPSVVDVDHLENAVDDEVTYTIKDVQVG